MNRNRNRNNGFLISLIVFGFLALIGVFLFNNSGVLNNNSKYYEVLNYYQKDQVLKSKLELTSGSLEYVLKQDPSKKLNYKVPAVKLFIDAVDEILRKKGKDDFSHAVDVIDYVRGQDYSWIFILRLV